MAVTYATQRTRKSRDHVGDIARAYKHAYHHARKLCDHRVVRFLPTVVALLVLASCGGSGDDLHVHTSFLVSAFGGTEASPLDPLVGQTLDVDIVWPKADSHLGDDSDSAGCKTTALLGTSTKTAHGATAMLVQTEILDRLPDWDLRLQLCDPGAGQSSVTVEAVINELNLAFGCFGVPASAQQRSGGYPLVTSFTAMQCTATILDVVDARPFGNQDFALTITTGPDALQ